MTDSAGSDALPAHDGPFEVLIAGAGVAGLEAAFALRALAGDRVAVSILSATDEFVYRPMSVAEPFSSGWARHYPLATLTEAAGAKLIQDAVIGVDAAGRRVLTASGAEFSYDALLICLGSTVHARYEHATTVDPAHMDDLLHGLVQDIEGGYVHSLAFIVPFPLPWPLPVYELALMASERAWSMGVDLSVTLLTPEKTPLASFGADVRLELSSLLAERKITLITGAYCDVPESKTVRIHPGDRSLHVDRVIALPELRGPAVSGLPSDIGGFIPIDDYTAVRGVTNVWAAGDATDYAVKHGGVSAQMADTAARAIAAQAGVTIQLRKFEPSLEGSLLTGAHPRLLQGVSKGARGVSPELRDHQAANVTQKIAAEYLAPHLAAMTPASPRSSNASPPVMATT